MHATVRDMGAPSCFWGVMVLCDSTVGLDGAGNVTYIHRSIIWKPTDAHNQYRHNQTHENSGKNKMVRRNKYQTKTNERRNPALGNNQTNEKNRKKKVSWKYDLAVFVVANFGWGWAGGLEFCDVRWFSYNKFFYVCLTTQQNRVNRKDPIIVP